MHDDVQIDDVRCPRCHHHETQSRHCDVCGGEGTREYMDAPEEWDEDCPSQANHLIECRECHGTGLQRWCPKCGADYWRAQRRSHVRA